MAGFLDFLMDPRFLTQIAAGIQAGGQFATSAALDRYGDQVVGAAQFTADQLREQSGDAMASAQRAAWNERRTAQYIASNTLAAAAGSGGGASDPTVINLIAQQAAEGAYREQVALYEGSTRARKLVQQAQTVEYQGRARQSEAQARSRTSALGGAMSLLGGFVKDSSLLQRFGGDGPSVNADAFGGDS